MAADIVLPDPTASNNFPNAMENLTTVGSYHPSHHGCISLPIRIETGHRNAELTRTLGLCTDPRMATLLGHMGIIAALWSRLGVGIAQID